MVGAACGLKRPLYRICEAILLLLLLVVVVLFVLLPVWLDRDMTHPLNTACVWLVGLYSLRLKDYVFDILYTF